MDRRSDMRQGFVRGKLTSLCNHSLLAICTQEKTVRVNSTFSLSNTRSWQVLGGPATAPQGVFAVNVSLTCFTMNLGHGRVVKKSFQTCHLRVSLMMIHHDDIMVKPYLSSISMAKYPTRGSSLRSWVIWKMHSEEHRVKRNWYSLVQE